MTIRPFDPVRAPPDPVARTLARAINEVQAGRLNVTLEVTLTAGVASTTVQDARFSEQSFVGFMPTTLNAAAELGAGGLYVSARTSGSITITHANNAQTDRTFVLLILG